jgi:hypothetical protein
MVKRLPVAFVTAIALVVPAAAAGTTAPVKTFSVWNEEPGEDVSVMREVPLPVTEEQAKRFSTPVPYAEPVEDPFPSRAHACRATTEDNTAVYLTE